MTTTATFTYVLVPAEDLDTGHIIDYTHLCGKETIAGDWRAVRGVSLVLAPSGHVRVWTMGREPVDVPIGTKVSAR